MLILKVKKMHKFNPLLIFGGVYLIGDIENYICSF